MWVVGKYVWLRCVVDGCGQLGWMGVHGFGACSFGMSVPVVLGGVWLEGCEWLRGVDDYGVWVVVESVWLEGYGGHRGVNI